MKKISAAAIGIIFFLLLTFSAYGQEFSTPPEEYESKLFEGLPGLAYEIFDEGISSSEVEEKSSFEYLGRLVLTSFEKSLGENSSVFLKVMALTVISAICAALTNGFEGKSNVEKCIAAALFSALFLFLNESFAISISYLKDLSNFAGTCAPILGGLYLCGGNTASAVVNASAFTFFAVIIDKLCVSVLLPTATACLGFTLTDSIGGDIKTSHISDYIKKLYMSVIGFFGLLLVGTLSLRTIISARADTLSTKTLSFAIKNSIPIVGSTVSSTLTTLGASISLIKSTVGVGGIISVIAITLPIAVYLLLLRSLLSLCGSVCGITGASACEKVLDGFKSATDMILAVIAMMSVIFILIITVFIKCSVAAEV